MNKKSLTYILKKHYIIGDVMSKVNPNDWESFDDMLNKKRDKKKKKARSLKEARNKRRKEKYGKKYN
jgi:hypothetical protein